MKRIFSLILCAALIISLAACNITENPVNAPTESTTEETTRPEEKNVLKIGVLVSQSENFSNEGKRAVLGIKYAAEKKKKITLGEEVYKVKLVVADTGSSGLSALEAANDMIHSGVNAVIASFSGGFAEAAKRLSQENIPIIDLSSESESITLESQNMFFLCPNSLSKARFCADYSNKTKNAEKVYILSDLANENSRACSLYFKERFESYGKKADIFYLENKKSSLADFAKRVKSSGYDLIYAPVSVSYAEELLSRLNTADCYADVIADDSWDTELILNYGDNGFNVCVPSSSRAVTDPELTSLFSSWLMNDEDLLYLNGGSKVCSPSSVRGINAYNLILSAVTKANSITPQAISQELKKISFSGVDGNTAFNASGFVKGVSYKMKETNYDYNTLDFTA